jgi:hypothetical protein
MRRFLLTAATAASALAVTSCSDVIGVRGNVAGTYELRTINGQFLPVTIDDQFGSSVTFVYGEIQLDNDGRFVDTYQYQLPTSSRVETEQIFGRWELEADDEIRFEPDDTRLDVYYMERTSSNRLVQRSQGGAVLVYERN